MARRVSGKKGAQGGSHGSRDASRASLRPKVRASSKRKKTLEKKSSEIWPNERAVLFKPERLKYVRKLDRPEGCVFCDAASGEPGFESLLLFKNEQAIVVLNKYPYNNGHLLILPRRHCGEFTELSSLELNEINRVLQASLRILKEVYGPGGFNVGLNLGSAAGAGIPEHLHYHVIPRWSGDTNFFPLIAETKVVVETLEQTYGRLVGYFEKLTS